MSICIVSIFKNESHILHEWISHYIKQGVDHIFMIDDNSNDNYIQILQPFIDEGKITLILNKLNYKQTAAYNNYCLERCKKYEWVIVCDLDEFIYARNGFNTINDYLNTVDETVEQIAIPWKMFGSNGYNTIEKKQPESVIKSFTKRGNYTKNICFGPSNIIDNNINYTYNKCIVKTSKLINFIVHSHITKNINNTITTDTQFSNIMNKNNKFLYNYQLSNTNETILQNSCLHLNHYSVQSLDFYMRIKTTRGDAYENCRKRTINNFITQNNNINEIDDLELHNINNYNV